MRDGSSELRQVPTVEIRYVGIKPEQSILRIDGVSLGQSIVDLGYPVSVVKPLIIIDKPDDTNIASYDYARGAIVINQRTVIETVRLVHDSVLQRMGEIKLEPTDQENDLVHKFIRSKFFETVFPAFWPYKMVKDVDYNFFAGNEQRRLRYLDAAKNGTLMPGKPLEEQRERARKFMERQIESGMARFVGSTLGHEYEHAHKPMSKFALKVGMFVAPVAVGVTVLNEITKVMEQAHVSASAASDAIILGVMGVGAMGIYGFTKGRAIEEQSSFDAGQINIQKYMDGFKIDHQVFVKEVLGKTE